ncbi:hypothetical protein DyAD56_18810 [Dyella sp. AD56]|nr:hypothetical protein DyAD56_18810 [Dyella sp. AD56]
MKSSLLAASLMSLAGAASADHPSGDRYLTPQFSAGQTYSNVFSILRSIKADGYDEHASRNGGSADYTILSASNDGWVTRAKGRYDGQASGDDSVEFRDNGRTYCQLNAGGKTSCNAYLEGSGLTYNATIWGIPPKQLVQGISWTVDVKQAWELGGSNGTEKVTVVSVDAATDTAVLLREGASEGFYSESDAHTVQLTHDGHTEILEVKPGTSHWKGYTTFVKGVVFSDELVVTRQDLLVSKSGSSVNATERRVMLLNAAPFPTL